MKKVFKPKKFGLKPEVLNTACWKGFVIYLAVRGERLYVDRLYVYTGDNGYPDIAGVRAKKAWEGFYVYKDLNLRLYYTGVVMVGKRSKQEVSPFYDITYELHFENGVLKSVKDSGLYKNPW